jgi:hypothetical protein
MGMGFGPLGTHTPSLFFRVPFGQRIIYYGIIMADLSETESRPYTEDELRDAQLPPGYDDIRYEQGFDTFQLTDLEIGHEYKRMLDDILESADNNLIVAVELKKLEDKLRVAFFRYHVFSTYDSGPVRQVAPEEWEEVKEQFKKDNIRAFFELDEIGKEIKKIYRGILPEWADPILKHDREEVLQAVSKNEQALRFASPELKANKRFIMEIVSQHGNALHYIPSKDPELLWHASKHGYDPNTREQTLIQRYTKTRKRDLLPVARSMKRNLSGLHKHGYHHKNKFGSFISSFLGHLPKGGTKRRR